LMPKGASGAGLSRREITNTSTVIAALRGLRVLRKATAMHVIVEMHTELQLIVALILPKLRNPTAE